MLYFEFSYFTSGKMPKKGENFNLGENNIWLNV